MAAAGVSNTITGGTAGMIAISATIGTSSEFMYASRASMPGSRCFEI
jgi:hypothetical protein